MDLNLSPIPYTLISLIKPKLAEMWANAKIYVPYMKAVVIHGLDTQVCSPDLQDALNPQIQPRRDVPKITTKLWSCMLAGLLGSQVYVKL